jgi:ribose 5-phosphate isomerase A
LAASTQAAQKHAVASAVAARVPDGIRLGLGSGSTLEVFLPLLAERVRAGLKLRCVPTSSRIEALARQYGLPLEALGSDALDLAVDVADEVDPQFQLVKGAGGALVRERIVAAAAKVFWVLVDGTKLVKHVGERMPLPIEIQQFGAQRTQRLVAEALGDATLRQGTSGPFISDNGGYLLDSRLGPIADLRALEAKLRAVPGVVDTGLFLDFQPKIFLPRGERVEMISPGELLD